MVVVVVFIVVMKPIEYGMTIFDLGYGAPTTTSGGKTERVRTCSMYGMQLSFISIRTCDPLIRFDKFDSQKYLFQVKYS